jgi:hypothetical protein
MEAAKMEAALFTLSAARELEELFNSARGEPTSRGARSISRSISANLVRQCGAADRLHLNIIGPASNKAAGRNVVRTARTVRAGLVRLRRSTGPRQRVEQSRPSGLRALREAARDHGRAIVRVDTSMRTGFMRNAWLSEETKRP